MRGLVNIIADATRMGLTRGFIRQWYCQVGLQPVRARSFSGLAFKVRTCVATCIKKGEGVTSTPPPKFSCVLHQRLLGAASSARAPLGGPGQFLG